MRAWAESMKNFTIVLTLALAVVFTGCEAGKLIGILGTPGYHERNVAAEYDLSAHRDKKILVLVNQPAWLAAGVNFRYYLTEAIDKNLAKMIGIPVGNLVPYSRLAELRSERDNFALLSPVELGAALEVDMVLVVEIDDYQLQPVSENTYYSGYLNTQVALLDSLTAKRLWPKSVPARSIKVGFEVEDRGKKVAVTRLIAASAYCTTRYLYDCPKNKFRVIEDRSGGAWENWK